MELQQWIFPQRFLRENLKLGEGGEEGRDNDIVREARRAGPIRRAHPSCTSSSTVISSPSPMPSAFSTARLSGRA